MNNMENLKNNNLGFEFVGKEYYLNEKNVKNINYKINIFGEFILKITYENNLKINIYFNENKTLDSIVFKYNINNNEIEKIVKFCNNEKVKWINYYLNDEYIMNNEELNKYINNNKILIRKLNKLEFLYIVFEILNNNNNKYNELLDKINNKIIINKLS